MNKAEIKNVVIPYLISTQSEPDLALGLINGRKIVREDGRFGFVTNVRSRKEALELQDDIEWATGALVYTGAAVDIDRTYEKGKVVEKRFGVGLWQRREPAHE